MIDLSTTYLGMPLASPLVASASPLSRSVDLVRRMEEAGAGAVVLFSLFEEQISHEARELDHYLETTAHGYAEATSYFPDLGSYSIGPEEYLTHIGRLKAAVRIPVIGSLNGASPGGWVEYAQRIEEAGADALELNIYHLPTDIHLSGGEIEESYVELVRGVRSRVRIPIAVKLGPFFSSIPNMCHRLTEAGADGLVLFNRFYQPDFDLDALEVVPNLKLSTSDELRLPLRWIAIMYGRIKADFALTSGVHNAEDALKALMAGSSAVMLTSELLARGVGRLSQILGDMRAWMVDREYESVTQMLGSMSQHAVADPEAFERANYMRALQSFS